MDILAHQIVDLAIQKGKAIAIENLKKLKKGMRGDGKAELRKRLHHWNAKKFLQKLKRVARLKGVEVIEVNPAYTLNRDTRLLHAGRQERIRETQERRGRT